MKTILPSSLLLAVAGLTIAATVAEPAAAKAAEIGRSEVFAVVEIDFTGPMCTPRDAPARDVDLAVRFERAGGPETLTVLGFWDGDGRGGSSGEKFKVRFCPTAAGRWNLAEVRSNEPRLRGQHQGDYVTAVQSSRPGFWLPDPESPGSRWYRRSDGSHPYIFGNTHYTFVSETGAAGPTGSSIAEDVRRNARYFKKLRFGLNGGRYPHAVDRPFRDDQGRPTDDGDFSHRPDPHWFHARIDTAVATAFEVDLIADLIISGPDTEGSRAALRAAANGGDNTPYLKYIAARYGSYPNVWICLANEWDIKTPHYTAAEIATAGATIRRFLPYPTPLSVHGNAGDWDVRLKTDPPWNDHVILQKKIRNLAPSADFMARNFRLGGGMPVVNDELGYQGGGDRFSREDVVEGHLGALLGGGYGTTGYKPTPKTGHYFWGAIDVGEHTAAANLGWLRQAIDRNVTFWKMRPIGPGAMFANCGEQARAMAWPGREYLLGTCQPTAGIVASLPAGKWMVRRFDAIAMQSAVLAEATDGQFEFDAPDSRAVLFHFQRAGD